MNTPVAIIGMACRFPDARNPAELKNLLFNGRDAVGEVPPDRWPVDRYYDPTPRTPAKMNSRTGGFLRGIDQFDPGFFGVSEREAAYMDPQQRLVLEVVWEGLESARLQADRLAGSRTGVFIGISNFDYNRLICRADAVLDAYCSTGTIQAIAANRVSYWLDLHGPSLAIDTACSSSLVAVCMACQSLESGESDLAIAGGVNLILTPEVSIILAQSGLLSSSGRCRPFDAEADGYVRSEGCGIVVLERLSAAQKNRRKILAVIAGRSVNQDGSTNGLTSPSAAAQQSLMRSALAGAGVEPFRVTHVEAHGTGTRLGDIVEMRSLMAVFMKDRPPENRCAVSSIKGNIGHAESAAGIAGLIKTAVMLQDGFIPPNVHFKKLGRHIKIDGTALYVPVCASPWPKGSGPRLAAVSSFGIGGTNAHLILEEAPSPPPPPEPPSGRATAAQLLVLSGRSETSLRSLAQCYAELLSVAAPESLDDVCYASHHDRTHLVHRLAVVGRSTEDLAALLRGFHQGHCAGSLRHGVAPSGDGPSIAFRFADAHPGHEEDARLLCECYPAFQSIYDQQCVRPSNASHSALHQSLQELWYAWGIRPAGVHPGQAQGPKPDGRDGIQWIGIGPACSRWDDVLLRLAELFTAGARIDWAGFDQRPREAFVDLPLYPFDRKRYWYDSV